MPRFSERRSPSVPHRKWQSHLHNRFPGKKSVTLTVRQLASRVHHPGLLPSKGRPTSSNKLFVAVIAIISSICSTLSSAEKVTADHRSRKGLNFIQSSLTSTQNQMPAKLSHHRCRHFPDLELPSSVIKWGWHSPRLDPPNHTSRISSFCII